MDIWHVFGLLGGLALFLHGMELMSDGLEQAAGSKIQSILAKLTTNKYLGVFFGMILTALIQSSSATTVMVVGFVNSQIMNLTQAINVILGANIGTTVTGLIIALDVTKYAPLLAFVGVMMTFVGKSKVKYWAKAFLGLGLLFMGLSLMSDSMIPLRDSRSFLSFMQTLSSPVAAIIFGMIFTALIQSSSASVGILQTMARQGLVPFHISFYIVLGQNVGTCITSVLASLSSSRASKRAALSHVLFNLSGAILFLIVSYMLPVADMISGLAPGLPASQIAYLHVIFNLGTALLFMPFTKHLAKLVEKIVPIKENESGRQKQLVYVKPDTFQNNLVMIKDIELEIYRLLDMVSGTVDASLTLFTGYKEDRAKEVREAVDTVRSLDKDLNRITVRMLSRRLNKVQSRILTNYLKILSHMERMADYVQRLIILAENNEVNNLAFSDYAKDEILGLDKELERMNGMLMEGSKGEFVEPLNHRIDEKLYEMIEMSENKHLERLGREECSPVSGMQYSSLLSGVERIGYHMKKIADAMDENREMEE